MSIKYFYAMHYNQATCFNLCMREAEDFVDSRLHLFYSNTNKTYVFFFKHFLTKEPCFDEQTQQYFDSATVFEIFYKG